jgi:hypothetical protein
MMNYSPLISHLERFARGDDRSVQWAKDAESLLDELEPWDQLLDEFQDDLSLYRPEGGPHLIDEAAMTALVQRTLETLKGRSVGGAEKL